MPLEMRSVFAHSCPGNLELLGYSGKALQFDGNSKYLMLNDMSTLGLVGGEARGYKRPIIGARDESRTMQVQTASVKSVGSSRARRRHSEFCTKSFDVLNAGDSRQWDPSVFGSIS